MHSTFAWFKVGGGVSGTDSSTITVAANTLGALTVDVAWESAVTGLNLSDSSGTAWMWNAQNALVVDSTATTYVAKTITINPSTGSNYHDSADDFKPYAGTYTLTVSSTTATTKAGGSSTDDRMRLGKTEAASYAATAGADLTFTVVITADGTLKIDSGSASLSPSTSVFVSAYGGLSSETYSADNVDTAVSGTISVALA